MEKWIVDFIFRLINLIIGIAIKPILKLLKSKKTIKRLIYIFLLIFIASLTFYLSYKENKINYEDGVINKYVKYTHPADFIIKKMEINNEEKFNLQQEDSSFSIKMNVKKKK